MNPNTHDRLFYNGKIYTMKEEGDIRQAIAFRDGRISFVGTNIQAKELEATEKIDLQGATAIPGMTDSHLHLYATGQNQTFVDLSEAEGIPEMIRALQKKAEDTTPGRWIKGVNFDQNKFAEKRFPTRQDLDEVSRQHPILIKRCCLHAAVANSKALEIAGITKGYDPGQGGIMEIDDRGEPNGIFREQAIKVFDEIIPDPLTDKPVKEEVFAKMLSEIHSKGLTAIHTYAAKIWNYPEDLAYYQQLEEKGQLGLRVTVSYDELFPPEMLSEEEQTNPYRLVNQGSYKLFTDGSFGSRSAALEEPYQDEPGNRGFLITTQEEFNEKMLTAYESGLQPAVHAIGDRALQMVLDGIEYTLETSRAHGMTKEQQQSRLPFRLIHVQLINPKLLEQMKQLPVVLDIQPSFLSTDLYWIEERLGKERVQRAYPWNTLWQNGLIQTGGSDCPVESFDPMEGIFAAHTRRSVTGFPEQGYQPQERLSMYQSVALFTKNPPFATGQQEVLGTLEVGKFADMAILDRDIFEVEEMQILDTKVQATYVAGQKVY